MINTKGKQPSKVPDAPKERHARPFGLLALYHIPDLLMISAFYRRLLSCSASQHMIDCVRH